MKKSFVALVGGLCAFVAAGFPLNPSFTPEAVKEYKAKADAGDAEAQLNLGFCYEYGEGVEKNIVEAVKWYRKSAAQGCALAQNVMGECCARGKGVERDMAEAVKWFRKAAEQGNAYSQLALSYCYKKGIVVTKDKAEFERWFRKCLDSVRAEDCSHRTKGWRVALGREEMLIIAYGRELIMSLALVLLLVCWVSIAITNNAKNFIPTATIGALRAKRSWMYCRTDTRWGLLFQLISAIFVTGMAVYMLFSPVGRWSDRYPFAGGGFLDDLFSGVFVFVWIVVAHVWGITVYRICNLKKARERATNESVQLTYTQYVKVVGLEGLPVLLPFLYLVFGWAWIEAYICATVALMLLLILAVCLRPTRKKYEKLLNGVPAKRTGNEYVVIYREQGDPTPKKATLVCAAETRLRAECAEREWEILYVRCVGDTRLLARFNRWCANPLRCPIHFDVSTAEIWQFCEVMKLLLAAGVPKEAAIEFCAREAPNAWFRKRLQIVLERLRSGDDLAHAMEDARCVKAFPPLLRKAIRIGEVNGHLGIALDRAKTALSLSEAKRHQLLRVEGSAILTLISAIAVFICSFNAASFADCASFCGQSAVMAGSGVFILLCKRWTERNIKAKIFSTRWYRWQRERGKGQDAWMRENNWFAVLLLVMTLIALPFGLEQIGEATELFRFPATAWVKGLWK